MLKDSLDEVLPQVLTTIEKSDIDFYDKVELLLNLRLFLNSENYENNIKILQRETKRYKR